MAMGIISKQIASLSDIDQPIISFKSSLGIRESFYMSASLRKCFDDVTLFLSVYKIVQA